MARNNTPPRYNKQRKHQISLKDIRETRELMERDMKYFMLDDVAVLLYCVKQAAEDPNIGYEDVRRTLDTLVYCLNKPVRIDSSVIESALWSANMLDEAGKFTHPQGLTFDAMVDKLLRGEATFNKDYNTITWKGEEEYGC